MSWTHREHQVPSVKFPQILFLLSFLDPHREVEVRDSVGHQNISCSFSQLKIELDKPSELGNHRGAEFLYMHLLFYSTIQSFKNIY